MAGLYLNLNDVDTSAQVLPKLERLQYLEFWYRGYSSPAPPDVDIQINIDCAANGTDTYVYYVDYPQNLHQRDMPGQRYGLT